jgi:hypothetical protein
VVQRVNAPPATFQTQTSPAVFAAEKLIASCVLSGEKRNPLSTPFGVCGCGRARRVRKSRTAMREYPSSFVAYARMRPSSESAKRSTFHFRSGVSTFSLPLASSISTRRRTSLLLFEITTTLRPSRANFGSSYKT